MGLCSSCTSIIPNDICADVKININSAHNGIIFQHKTANTKFVSDAYTNKFRTKERSPTFKEYISRSDYFSSGSPSTTVCTKKQDMTNYPASEASTSSLNSSTLSDSFDLADLVTFDGLNKRATNRNDIGLDILKATLHFGADPQRMSTHGERSCLMFAVIANDYNFTKNLVEQGVDVNKRNRFGETALGLAIELKRDEIASFLRLKGATL